MIDDQVAIILHGQVVRTLILGIGCPIRNPGNVPRMKRTVRPVPRKIGSLDVLQHQISVIFLHIEPKGSARGIEAMTETELYRRIVRCPHWPHLTENVSRGYDDI